MINKRLQGVIVNGETLAKMLCGWSVESIANLPPSAKYHHAYYRPETGDVVIVFEDESFPLCGSHLPLREGFKDSELVQVEIYKTGREVLLKFASQSAADQWLNGRAALEQTRREFNRRGMQVCL